MGESLVKYVEWVELQTFFSGYILVYVLVFWSKIYPRFAGLFKNNLLKKLPLAYALTGTFYLGLQLKNAYPDFQVHLSFLKIWGLTSILFWIPALQRKPMYSFIHNSIFFILLVYDSCAQLISPSGSRDFAMNNIKIYCISFLINLTALLLMHFILLINKHVKS
jgi:hypothetical protein